MKHTALWAAVGALCTLATAGSVRADDGIIFSDGFDYTGCPAGRQTVADVAYRYSLTNSSTAFNVDVTHAENLWGRTSPTDVILGFPWDNYFAIIRNFDKDSYIAAEFTVPEDADPDMYGMFSHGETLPGPNITMAISQFCGDFTPVHSICLRTNIYPGGLLTKYKLPGAIDPRTQQPVVACPLEPGGTYYVNIKMTNPPASHPDCDGNECNVTVQNNW